MYLDSEVIMYVFRVIDININCVYLDSEVIMCVFRVVDPNDPSQVESLGIIVQYKVKVRLILGFGSG